MIEYISDSIEIAKHIAYLCEKLSYDYNNTKIQKLMFACYGVTLVRCDGKRLVDESPVVWPYGPVYLKVFNFINNLDNEGYSLEKRDLDSSLASLLENIVKAFGKYRAGILSGWSHKKDSPWDIVVNKMDSKWGTLIPDGVIEKYFREEVLAK